MALVAMAPGCYGDTVGGRQDDGPGSSAGTQWLLRPMVAIVLVAKAHGCYGPWLLWPWLLRPIVAMVTQLVAGKMMDQGPVLVLSGCYGPGCYGPCLLWSMVAKAHGCYGPWLLRHMVAMVTQLVAGKMMDQGPVLVLSGC